MHILYVHKNFPAQFGHIARHLVSKHGFECTFVSEHPSAMVGGIRRIQCQPKSGATSATHYCSRSFENYVWTSHAIYDTLRNHPDVQPDLVVGHSGFGSTLFLADLYSSPIINYFEYYYRSKNSDMDFRTEFPTSELDILGARSRNAMLLLDLQTCAAGYSPTEWQRSVFPQEYQNKLDVIFDGIDTSLWSRRPKRDSVPRQFGKASIPPGYRVVTYVSRGFESMRGFDIFMKVAKRICEIRRDVVFVCVGSDRVCYGGDLDHIPQQSFREHVLSQDQYDLSRILFTGMLPTDKLAELFSISDLHIYLTVPFVLSWSMMNALACGCTVLASDTPPVREMIQHEHNGLLAGFHDVEAFVSQALKVLDDPEAYHPLGAAAAEMIQEKYSLDATLPRMLALYERIANRQSGGSTSETSPTVLIESNGHASPGIQRLHSKYPWPPAPVQVQPRSNSAMTAGYEVTLRRVLSCAVRVVVEIGSSIEMCSEFVAGQVPQATLIGIVPPLESSLEADSDAARSSPPAMLDDRATPQHELNILRAGSTPAQRNAVGICLPVPDALRAIAAHDIRPDVIIFGGEASDCLENIQTARKLFPNAVLVGDDWPVSSVQSTIARILESDVLELGIEQDVWRIWNMPL